MRVIKSAIAAAPITAVAIYVSDLLRVPLTRLAMIFLSEPSRTINAISGGATTPLMTPLRRVPVSGRFATG